MGGVSSVIEKFVALIIDPTIKIIFAAGFFLFIWGFIEFFWKLGQGNDQNQGKMHMVWGVVGMLIMVSVKGIINLILDTFGINPGDIGSF